MNKLKLKTTMKLTQTKATLFVLLWLILYSCTAPTTDTIQVIERAQRTDNSTDILRIMIEAKISKSKDSSLAVGDQNLRASDLIKDFYSKRKHQPVWIADYKPNKNSREILDLMQHANYYGLDSSFYNYFALKNLYDSLLNETDRKEMYKMMANYELLLTNSSLLFLSHLQKGILFHRDTALYGMVYPKLTPYLPIHLEKTISSKYVTKAFLSIQPNHYEYVNLQKGLENFLKTKTLSKKKFTLPHYKDDSAACYQKTPDVLKHLGYWKPDSTASPDSVFVHSLKNFQKYHGLREDGKIGQNTYKALQFSTYDRYQQILINMERLRWEPKPPEHYVWINIPSYKLKVFKNNELKIEHKVITGASWSPTPLMNEEIEYFRTYPMWHVPYSISSRELLPRIKSDSTYLARNRYRIYTQDRKPVDPGSVDWNAMNLETFNYKISQAGGWGNSLGKLIFMFPNESYIYLHDTPGRYLFKNGVRAYSHGCIRLHGPEKFAEYLLESDNQKAYIDTFRMFIEKGKRRHIPLNTKLPIQIRYITCEGDTAGNLYFYHDIYRRDESLKQRFFQKDAYLIALQKSN